MNYVLHTSIGIALGIGVARGQYYWILDIERSSFPLLDGVLNLSVMSYLHFFSVFSHHLIELPEPFIRPVSKSVQVLIRSLIFF